MKKFVLIFLMIFGYASYAMFQHASDSATVSIAPPPGLSMNTSPAASSFDTSAGSAPPPSDSSSDTSSESSTIQTQIVPTNQPSAIPSTTVVQNTNPSPVPVMPTPKPTKPISKPNPKPVPTPTPTPVPKGRYVDGSYTGSIADAYYGNVQIQARVSGGKLTGVTFLQYPNDRSTSRRINSQAMPYLQQEAIQAQSANVNTVSGASDTSQAFRESLSSALAQAKS